MDKRNMDTDSINDLEFRKGIHSTFHMLSLALRNGNDTDELMADILQQIHIAYAAKDDELLETLLEDIRPHTEIILAEAIEGLDKIEQEIRHMRVINNIIGISLN